jgi:uncharacterized membrane protein
MRTEKSVRNLMFIILAILLVAVIFITFMTYNTDGGDSPFLRFAVGHHTAIMAGLIVISLIFGFVSSQFFYAALQRKKQDSKTILGVVLLFLSREEREIVNYLVAQQGTTTQAEIARLPHMNRVKAYRSLQKMQEKQIIELVPHGKIRKVHLKQNILDILNENP